VRLASPCQGSQQKQTYNQPTSAARICRVIKIEHEQGREAEMMCLPCPNKELPVETVILRDFTAVMRLVNCRSREMEFGVGAEAHMWWKHGSQSREGKVGATAVCHERHGCPAFRRHLGTGRMEAYDAQVRAFRLTLCDAVKARDTLYTCCNKGSQLERLTRSHSTNAAPGIWCRAEPRFVD